MAASPRSGRDPSYKLDTLGALLESAVHLLREMADDPYLSRLVNAYARMPREDRPIVVDVVEREVGLRVTTLNGGDAITGVGVRPNPNARLYLRVIEKLEDKVPTLAHDEMVFSNLRGARIMRLVLAPEIHDAWRAAAQEAFGLLKPDDRRAVRTVLGELREILDQVEGDRSDDD